MSFTKANVLMAPGWLWAIRWRPLRERATAAEIAAKAKGPAAKELAWEGWLQAERGWIATIDEGTARVRFEYWWKTR
jgi:hypothetical protein